MLSADTVREDARSSVLHKGRSTLPLNDGGGMGWLTSTSPSGRCVRTRKLHSAAKRTGAAVSSPSCLSSLDGGSLPERPVRNSTRNNPAPASLLNAADRAPLFQGLAGTPIC